LARILLRSDPSVVLFIQESPHVESAARVSVQTVTASVQAIRLGMEQVRKEMLVARKAASAAASNDRFAVVMEAFVKHASPVVEAVGEESKAMEASLRSLLAYYGEDDSKTTSEDFFGLVMSFSSSLQKAALDIHEEPPTPTIPSLVLPVQEEKEESKVPEDSSRGDTIKANQDNLTATRQMHMMPPPSWRGNGHHSVGRGDFDEAIRSLRDGQRRARPNRPLSKIFLDGSAN